MCYEFCHFLGSEDFEHIQTIGILVIFLLISCLQSEQGAQFFYDQGCLDRRDVRMERGRGRGRGQGRGQGGKRQYDRDEGPPRKKPRE